MYPAVVKLENQPGGSIADHWGAYQAYGRGNTQIQVVSDCISACTLILGAIDKSKLCFGRNALLGFHQARRLQPNGMLYSIDYETTKWVIAKYPADIQAWIQARGGYMKVPVNGFWLLSAQDLWAMGYRKCDV
jgi:hypothetical protein